MSLSHVQLLVTPWTAAHQAPLSMGFSRQEYWSGVPLPSPTVNARVHISFQLTVFSMLLLLSHFRLCLTLCNPIDGRPLGSAIPGILQARTLEWGCHFLLQCMKVKSEREVTQSCPTLHDPMDYSSPGSSVHGIFQARILEWGAIAFSILNPSAFLEMILS